MISPVSPLFALLFLTQLLFGIAYNAAIAHLQKWQLWHVSTSVIGGVSGTLLIATAFLYDVNMPFWGAALVFFGCFAASGLPMTVGSWLRSLDERKKSHAHKRRAWPNSAKQARDESLMELSRLAHDIADASERGEISIKHLPGYVHRIYQVIGTLKST